MSDRGAFLRAIRDRPHDDAPRLVYADWLDEHGDPERAEFIRTQCELARGVADPARAAALAKREEFLLKKHRAAWEKEIPAWARRQVGFARGMVNHVQSTVRDFLKGAAGLFRRAPVQSVHFRSFKGHEKNLAASPFLARLTALSFRAQYGDRL